MMDAETEAPHIAAEGVIEGWQPFGTRGSLFRGGGLLPVGGERAVQPGVGADEPVLSSFSSFSSFSFSDSREGAQSPSRGSPDASQRSPGHAQHTPGSSEAPSLFHGVIASPVWQEQHRGPGGDGW